MQLDKFVVSIVWQESRSQTPLAETAESNVSSRYDDKNSEQEWMVDVGQFLPCPEFSGEARCSATIFSLVTWFEKIYYFSKVLYIEHTL